LFGFRGRIAQLVKSLDVHLRIAGLSLTAGTENIIAEDKWADLAQRILLRRINGRTWRREYYCGE